MQDGAVSSYYPPSILSAVGRTNKFKQACDPLGYVEPSNVALHLGGTLFYQLVSLLVEEAKEPV